MIMNESPVQPKRGARHRVRLLIGAACTVVLAAVSVTLAGIANAEADRTLTANSTGTHNGFFYS